MMTTVISQLTEMTKVIIANNDDHSNQAAHNDDHSNQTAHNDDHSN